MEKIVITKAQKKILIVAGIAMVSLAAFVYIIYLPLRQKAVELKQEWKRTENEIMDIRRTVGRDKPLETAIAMLKEKLESIDRKFPDKEEVILRELSQAASRSGIEVISITPQKKRQVQEVGGNRVNIRDCSVEEMPVKMSLKASYKTLGEFLKTIKSDDFPVFLRVEDVTMARAGDKKQQLLSVGLELDSYLICSAKDR